MSASALPDLVSLVRACCQQGRRTWQAALVVFVVAAWSPFAQAGAGAIQGKLVLIEGSDTAELEGNPIHDWRRIYRQGWGVFGDFGSGWAGPFESRLIRMPQGTVVIADAEAGLIEYPARDEESRSREAALLARESEKEHYVRKAEDLRRSLLERLHLVGNLNLAPAPTPSGTRWRHPFCADANAGVLQRENGYVHTSCGGRVEYFNRDGYLTELRFKLDSVSAKNRPKHILRFERNDSGALLGVADGTGARIDLVREEGRIVAVRSRQDTTEMEIRYAYDERGRLASVKRVVGPDKLKTLHSYSYDAEGRLVEADKSRFSYDAEDRVATIESDGARKTYTYTLADDGTAVTRMEWQPVSGNKPPIVQISEDDKYGRPVVSYDGAGNRIQIDPRTGQVLMKTDPSGVEWRYFTDAGKRLIMIKGSNGDETHIKYGGNGLPNELKLKAGPVGKNGEPTEQGQLLAPNTSGVIKLTWQAKGKPTRIAWMGRCIIRMGYGADGEAANPVFDGTPECQNQLGNIYRSFFD